MGEVQQDEIFSQPDSEIDMESMDELLSQGEFIPPIPEDI